MHFIADLFTWYFVERTDKTTGASRVELWREEDVIGVMALYHQEQIPSLEAGGIIEPWLANDLYIHSWPVCIKPAPQETFRFLGALKRERTVVLNNASAEDELAGAKSGRILCQAVLDCFLAGMGRPRELTHEDAQLLQQVAHVWMLVALPSQHSTDFHLCAYSRYPTDQVKFPPIDLMRTRLMEIDDGDNESRQLAWAFPRDACDYFSALGAIARTDPFRFDAVKGLLAHAAHLGLERNPDPNNLPVPSLQED